jgi:hypothetical protein
VTSCIAQRAAKARERLTAYLRQEGVFDGPAWGLVDVGWRGRVQNSLAAVVTAAGGTPPVGFYVALACSAAEQKSGERHCYLYDRSQDMGYIAERLPLALPIELFCTADHGVVLGYEHADGAVRPVLRGGHNHTAEEWGLAMHQRAICTFADHLLLDADLVNPRADLRVPLLELLRTFWLAPQLAEAAAWGSFEFEADQSGDARHLLAEPYRWRSLPALWMDGELVPRHTVDWVAGSLALTHRPVRLAQRASLAVRSLLGGLVRRCSRLTGRLLPRIKHVPLRSPDFAPTFTIAGSAKEQAQ